MYANFPCWHSWRFRKQNLWIDEGRKWDKKLFLIKISKQYTFDFLSCVWDFRQSFVSVQQLSIYLSMGSPKPWKIHLIQYNNLFNIVTQGVVAHSPDPESTVCLRESTQINRVSTQIDPNQPCVNPNQPCVYSNQPESTVCWPKSTQINPNQPCVNQNQTE